MSDKTLLVSITFIGTLGISDVDSGQDLITILLFFAKALFTNLFRISIETASILTSIVVSQLGKLSLKNWTS